MRRIAVVTSWFGAELRGGAERQARELSLRLAARGHSVEVLTTCARSPQDDWSHNYYPEGIANENGLIVRRFRVDARDAAAFDRANVALLAVSENDLKVGVSPVANETARAFVEHNINSSTLINFLRAEGTRFDALIFLPYLYGTTLGGVTAAPARALLQPCLHAEAYAFLPAIAETFRRARRLLFNSEGERELALRLYGPGTHTRSRVVGEGVEFTPRDAETINESRNDGEARAHNEASTSDEALTNDVLTRELQGARFVLYLGRRDETKNVPLLVRAFRRFKIERPASQLSLVLAGDGLESFDARDAGIFDLGVVAEEVKAALLCAARALFQPSRRESFSRVIFESWLAARPVAANAECAPTATAVESAGGGWLAASEDEWARAFATVDDAGDQELNELGLRGQTFAHAHADWERVVECYEKIFDELDEEDGALSREGQLSREVSARVTAPSPRVVHQLITDAVYGDAITNHALSIRDRLRSSGLKARVHALRCEDSLRGQVELFDASHLAPSDALIYHHSIGSGITAAAVAHAGAKCLVYHNITPAEYFARDRPGFAWLLEMGRAALPRLARHFPVSVGDSAYNAAELAACGFASPGVLPILVDPDRWNVAPDEDLMRELHDGATNLLFVGRFAPNKRQDALVQIFSEYVKLDAHARLIIAGEGRDADPYFRRVKHLIERLGLARRVRVTARVTDAALLAYYRTAHLYLSPSEHEGFGVPLVEAMWFDVPVLARRGTAVNETLADAGALYDEQASPTEIAQLAHRLARTDAELRRRVVAAERTRREAFTPAALRPVIDDLLRRMTEASAPRAAVA
jgi:glycosyltransferase involved in cell wall biosynthesis